MNRLDEIVNVFVHPQKAGWTDYYYARDGRMEKAVTHTGNTETYTYNGRSITTKKNGKTYTKTLDSWDYVYSNIYDNWGRLTRHIAPNGYMLQYTYDNTDSHLTRVADGNNKTLWTYIRNIPGRESSCRLGNQLRSEALSSENEEESILKWIRPNGTALLEMNYSLDPILGNVTSRTEKYAGRSFTENFKYDEMDRLTQISGSSSMLMAYEPNGNITFKQNIGFYRYNDGRRTHALTSIEVPTEQLKKLATQTVTYTEFNKVASVHEGAYKMVFWYGADEQRIKSELYRNTLRIRTIYYGDGFERHIDANGNSKEYTYLDSDGGYFGMVITENETSSTYYFHTDLLGSLVAISDDNGNIVERRSYDAWGRRRNPNDWTDYNSNRTLELTLIGYTFQEEMPEFNLINLNGRLYDPLLGRMLSPDPFIQDPENSQNYNRYSYAWNNPMKYSDPNGNFIFGAVFGPLGSILDGMICSTWLYAAQVGLHWKAKDFFKSILIGGLSGGIGGFAGGLLKTTGFISGAINGAIGGFTSGIVSGSLSAWTNGASFAQGLKVGLKGGSFGAISGALIGGIVGGSQANEQNLIYKEGCENLGLNKNDEVPATDEFLSKAQKEWFKDAPMKDIDKFTVENVPEKTLNNMILNNAPAATKGIMRNGLYTGRSNVYFNKHLAFSSAEELFSAMGHEFVHVSQYTLLKGYPYNSIIREIMDYHAYSYQAILGYSKFNGFDTRVLMEAQPEWFVKLNYINFKWTQNHNFRNIF